MATPTYDPIASTTLASSAASVTFSSLNTIAAGYRDLIVVINGQTTAGGILFRVNGDTGANYNLVTMAGNGSTTVSSSSSGETLGVIGSWNYGWSSNQGVANVSFLDFAATDKHKSVLSRANIPALATEASATRWANTAAITSILLFPGASGSFAAGSVFSLYGISA